MLTNIDYIRKSRVTHSDRYSQCYYNYPEILTCCIERVSDEKMAFITWLYMYMQCYAIYDVYNESVPFFYIYERKFIHMYIDYLNPSNRLFDEALKNCCTVIRGYSLIVFESAPSNSLIRLAIQVDEYFKMQTKDAPLPKFIKLLRYRSR
jgi:hypothetical protein